MQVGKVGIYQNTTYTNVGTDRITTTNGIYKNNKIQIISTHRKGKLINKLYYVCSEIGEHIKSKLVEFVDGKKIKDNIDNLLK